MMRNYTALKIVIAYLLFGIVWILFSDFFLKQFAGSSEIYYTIQSVKGIIFVIASTILIFILSLKLVSNELKSKELEKNRIVDNYENLINIKDASADELRLSHQHLNALVESEIQAFVLCGKDGRIMLFNKTAEKYVPAATGRPLIKGKNFHDYAAPEYAEIYKKNFETALSGKSAVSERKFTIEGRERWIRFNYSPAYDSQNNIFGVVFTGIEITESVETMNKLKQSIEVYEDLLKATPDGVAITRSDGILEYMSPVALEMLKIDTPEEAIGKSCLNYFSEDSIDRVNKAIEKITINGENTKGNIYTLVRTDGTTFAAEFNSSPIRNSEGKITSFISTFRDVTIRIEAEKRRNEYSKELRDLNASKDKFFSIIAHDLRNPLQGLLGFSGLLNDNYDELTDEEKREYIGYVYQSSKKMHSLTNNLLQWSRIKTGNINFNPERLALNEAIIHNTELLKPNAVSKGISIKILNQDSLEVFCDRNMLDSILQNLISNSIKFSKSPSSVEISAQRINPQFIQVSVKDYGVGIAKENFGRIFSIDTHFSTTGTNNEEGTGLGLILCKELVEKQGGTIHFESAIGKGSTFHFTIPSAN